MGITTIGRLAECPLQYLTYKFGKMGAVLQCFARGMDSSPVKRQDYVREVKSVGNSATTPRDLTCDEDVHLMLFLPVFYCDELGTMPPFDILPLFSAGRSRRLTLVPII